MAWLIPIAHASTRVHHDHAAYATIPLEVRRRGIPLKMMILAKAMEPQGKVKLSNGRVSLTKIGITIASRLPHRS